MIEIPLLLWRCPHWELRGRPDSELFFRTLSAAFPAATTVFVEGSMMAGEVEEFFQEVGEAGPYLPARQTLWPLSRQFRVPANGEILHRLANLASRHAEPEILDHFFVYAGTAPLIEYPDAFASGGVIWVSRELPEAEVRWFASELRLRVAEAGGT